jgi:hypothetical protein
MLNIESRVILKIQLVELILIAYLNSFLLEPNLGEKISNLFSLILHNSTSSLAFFNTNTLTEFLFLKPQTRKQPGAGFRLVSFCYQLE